MSTNILDRISFWSLFIVVVLLPVFFLPLSNIPVETSKGLLLVAGLAVSIIFWAMARFADGKIVLPKSFLLLSGFGIIIVFLVSAILSHPSSVSLFGIMLDVGTFWFMLGAFLLMLFSSIIFRDSKNATILLIGLVLSSTALLVFQAVHLFKPQILSLGVLSGKVDNLLGSWNAFGIFAGLFCLILLLTIEFFSVAKIVKWILGVFLVLGLASVAVVNFPLVWEILGFSALVIFIYKASTSANENREEGKKIHIPFFSFAVVIVALLFIMSGSFFGGLITNRLGVTNNEINPSFKGTMLITGSALKQNPVFGVGPNKFEKAWALYKPASTNTTQFWDVAFGSGSGLLPTFATTTGYLGVLAWLIFFALLIRAGVKYIFSAGKKILSSKMAAFFVLSLYLFIFSFFYPVGSVLFLLAFAFTGVFIGLSAASDPKGEMSINFLEDHRKSFFSMSLLIAVMIVTAGISFKYAERLVSVSYFRKALASTTVADAEFSIGKAVALYQNDLYFRTYAQVYLLKLNSLAQKDTTPTDADKAELQATLNQVVNGAQSAVAYDSTNFLNLQTLGLMYQSLNLFGIKDSNSKAVEAWKSASDLNPTNPRLKLSIARSYMADGNTDQAKSYADAAFVLKGDYVDTLVTLSQIAKMQNDNAKAISYAQTALSLAPNDKNLINYVDSLKGGSSSDTTKASTKKKTQ